MRESKEDLRKAAAIVSAHGHTDIAEQIVDRGDLDWNKVTEAGVGMHFEGEE